MEAGVVLCGKQMERILEWGMEPFVKTEDDIILLKYGKSDVFFRPCMGIHSFRPAYPVLGE